MVTSARIPSNDPSSPEPTADALLAAARSLTPAIRAASADVERERRLPVPLLDALHEAGMFRMAIAREYGGLEADALTIARVVEELSAADGSVGWCVMVASQAASMLALLPEQTAERLSAEPRLVVAGTLMPGGQAAVVDGGYRLSGRWGFASGILHSNWLYATAVVIDGDTPRLGPAGRPVTRIAVVPIGDATIEDTWSTSGLRGTGSHHFTLDNVYVPEDYTFDPEPALSGRADPPRNPYPLYRCLTFIGTGFGAVPLGIARAALEEFLRLAQSKTPWRATRVLREEGRVQGEVARAHAQLEASRAFLHSAIGDLWETVVSTGRSTPQQRARVPLAMTFACENAVEVVDAIGRLAATSALYTPNLFDQCLRDVRAAAAHRAVRSNTYEAAGRVALGLEAREPFF